jgi:purine nucleoside permease
MLARCYGRVEDDERTIFCGEALLAWFKRASILLVTAALAGTSPAQARPIEIRMVVVTAFEVGAVTGDTAGELQNWAEAIPTELPLVGGDHPLRYDVKRRVLVLNTGIGTNRAATATMALGSDPRFDLTHAYWMIAAIAGVNPNTGSVGSAAWIGDLVDTDYGYAIDPREAPADWTAGIFARDSKRPYGEPRGETKYNLYPLNKGLRDWAYALTADMALPDSPVLANIRAGYPKFVAAQCAPVVVAGDEATGQTFWHGKLMNDHTERWVAYWTGRQGSFVMTGMEDTGVAHALRVLQGQSKADASRLLVLRTASNYTVQPEGSDAASSLSAEAMGLSALKPSVDAAYNVGSRVVDEITGNWPRYRALVPTGAPAPLLDPALCKKPAG